MLLLIEDLCVVQGDIGHGAEGFGQLVLTGAEHGVLIQIRAAHDGLEAFLGKNSNAINPTANPQSSVRPALSQQRDVGTGHNAALGIDDAEGSVGNIL